MGTYNGEYYEEFSKKPEATNKITLLKEAFDKHDINNIEIGFAIAAAQRKTEKNKNTKIDDVLKEYMESKERQEPIDYVVKVTEEEER